MTNSGFKALFAILCISLVLMVSACAKSQQPDVTYKAHEMSDPLEPLNRFFFGFNDVLDRIIIEPVAKGYHAFVPPFVRNSIQNFMHNLKSPLIVANNLLQGDIGDAGVATARFVMNSTVGIGGLIDVAETRGLSYEEEDLGQTLGAWGIGDGFYLVLPIFGPSSLRDTAGMVGDTFADPVRIIAFNTDNEWIYYTRGLVEGLDTRSRLLQAIADMRRNSVDYYAAARSAYTQKRQSLIRDEKPGTSSQNAGYDEIQ